MNRRGFLKMLVGGVAVAAAAPSFPFRVFSFPSEVKIAQPEIVQAVIGEYSDYFSFSDYSLAVAMDESVAKAAAELGYRAGRELDLMVETRFEPEKQFKFFAKSWESKWVTAPQPA